MIERYTLKVYPQGRGRDVYRTIEICGNDTLDTLCWTIIECFDFFDEHLYEFCMNNQIYSEGNYQSNPEFGEKSTNISLNALSLKKGQKFLLHYDFGDDWVFVIRVTKIDTIQTYQDPTEIQAKGKIQQYPDLDDDDEDDMDENDENESVDDKD